MFISALMDNVDVSNVDVLVSFANRLCDVILSLILTSYSGASLQKIMVNACRTNNTMLNVLMSSAEPNL